MKNNNSTLITATLVSLGVYNFFYWASKSGKLFPAFHESVIGHWKLMMFFEFLAVASVGVDLIVRYDKFPPKERRFRLVVTASFCLLFLLKLIFGVIELYMRGGVS